MKVSVLFFPYILIGFLAFAQQRKADSLRGNYGIGRNWWDIRHYELSVTFHIESKTILGSNKINILASKATGDVFFQIDLQDPMVLDSAVVYNNTRRLGALGPPEKFKQGDAYIFPFKNQWISSQGISGLDVMTYFHGTPKEAKHPPWDGGIIWTKDNNGNPWVSLACQLTGASVWFPCKDSQVDEPENGVDMYYTCPSNLVCVSNGKLLKKIQKANNCTTYWWQVKNPINNYCMIPYVGDYVHFQENFKGEKGILDLDYWVLRGHLEEAKIAFKDVPKTLKAFEYWFGAYPFYEDGYKLVESPHLGMEHQSAVAYGNGFSPGYRGRDLSGTGEGLKWDFIIVHESGHEWFGNNITTKDVADMWVHEGFTSYSEVLFLQYWFGKDAANRYSNGIQKAIMNDKPIVGEYGLNKKGSGDMYFKASCMLHLMHLWSGDQAFRKMLRTINKTYYHSTVTTQEIEELMEKILNLNLKPVFNQYLRQSNPPELQLKQDNRELKYRWVNCIEGFEMPFFTDKGAIHCTTQWQSQTFFGDFPVLRNDQYVKVNRLKN